jgi:hypothetical protein
MLWPDIVIELLAFLRILLLHHCPFADSSVVARLPDRFRYDGLRQACQCLPAAHRYFRDIAAQFHSVPKPMY